jgi:hypothetical protein
MIVRVVRAPAESASGSPDNAMCGIALAESRTASAVSEPARSCGLLRWESFPTTVDRPIHRAASRRVRACGDHARSHWSRSRAGQHETTDVDGDPGGAGRGRSTSRGGRWRAARRPSRSPGRAGGDRRAPSAPCDRAGCRGWTPGADRSGTAARRRCAPIARPPGRRRTRRPGRPSQPRRPVGAPVAPRLADLAQDAAQVPRRVAEGVASGFKSHWGHFFSPARCHL